MEPAVNCLLIFIIFYGKIYIKLQENRFGCLYGLYFLMFFLHINCYRTYYIKIYFLSLAGLPFMGVAGLPATHLEEHVFCV